MNADSGVFVEEAFQTGFADAAETGDFRKGGLTVDVAVEKVYRPAEEDGVRRAGRGGNGSCFGKREHEKLQVRGHRLGIGGQPVKGLQIAAVTIRIPAEGTFRVSAWGVFRFPPGKVKQIQQELLLGVCERKHLSRSQAVSGPSAAKEKMNRSAPSAPVTMNLCSSSGL